MPVCLKRIMVKHAVLVFLKAKWGYCGSKEDLFSGRGPHVTQLNCSEFFVMHVSAVTLRVIGVLSVWFIIIYYTVAKGSLNWNDFSTSSTCFLQEKAFSERK